MEKVKLGDICEVFSGFAFKTFNEDKQGKPVIKIGNIQIDGKISLEECSYTKEIPQEKYFSKVNDIYIALSGATTGKVGIMEQGDFLINQRVGVVRLKNNNIPINYLFSFLKSKTVTILQDAFGAAQPNISPKDILNYEIPLPSLEEQKAIAGKLDKVSGLIEKRKTQLKKLDLLIKSRFIEMFGDPVSNDKGWQHQAMDKVAPSSAGLGDNSETVWLLNLDMVEAQTGRILDYLYVEKEQVGTSTCAFDEGNVLYSKLRPYLNKVVVPTKKGYCTTELVPLRPNGKLNRQFLAYLLRSEAFVSFINEKVAGAKMPRVSMSVFRDFECILPPIDLQNKFATFVEQIDKSKFEIQKSLEKLEILKKSLMQQYFG